MAGNQPFFLDETDFHLAILRRHEYAGQVRRRMTKRQGAGQRRATEGNYLRTCLRLGEYH